MIIIFANSLDPDQGGCSLFDESFTQIFCNLLSFHFLLSFGTLDLVCNIGYVGPTRFAQMIILG